MPEIFIYDEIGPAWFGLVDAKSVIDQLPSSGEVTVRINSPGGDVNEAAAMYNAFARHDGAVIMEIDALAASAMSYVVMAGDQINIAANAMMMVHNPWTIAMGDAEELRQTAGVLDKYRSSAVKVYAARTESTEEQIGELMDAETWMTADEAVEMGFADSIGQDLNVSAAIRPGLKFKNIPQRLLTPQAKTANRVTAALVEQLHIARRRALTGS